MALSLWVREVRMDAFEVHSFIVQRMVERPWKEEVIHVRKPN
jgi:hypothetical protein